MHLTLWARLPALGDSLASLFAYSITTAATTVAVLDIFLDRHPDMWESFARLSGKAFKIAYTAFLVELTVAFGSMLCLIPGIYWAGKYGIAVPAAVVENISGVPALKRSGALTIDAVGRIISVFFLTSICTSILVAALNEAARLAGWTLPSYRGILTPKMLRLTTRALGGIVFGPISAIALALEYFDQRLRKEGFDSEQMRLQMMVPENLASRTSAS